MTLFLKIATICTYQAEKLKTKYRKKKKKNLLIIIAVLLNALLVACTNDQAAPVAQESAIDYAAVYNETMKNIIANDSNFATSMTNDQVIENNAEVFAELQNTLKASGCYNEQIEVAYFNAEAIKLGYKPAEFAAMCMIAN